mgnify:FL=1|jgi:K+/H+ antiporter YhaU regulatory subunit KhtT
MYQIIIEIFSSIFSIEGVQIDKSKFQVISILTGTGFTTNESELMLSTKRRRKLTQILILFSYLFNITIVSTIINLFISTSNVTAEELIIGVILTLTNIILLIILNKATRVRKFFDMIIRNIEIKRMEKRKNPMSIYDRYGDKVIAEVVLIKMNNKLKNTNVMKINKEYGIQILVIKRGEEIISNLNEKINLKEGDVLLVFGAEKLIRKVLVRNNINKKV